MESAIRPCTMDHLERYGVIYATAFSGEPWNEKWSVEDATCHVKELMGNSQHYGLEYLFEGEVAGFILGTSMLFHFGRIFEINDLAVASQYQRKGIARQLLTQCISDMKQKGIKGFYLITAAEGILPSFYEKFGFKKENRVILMGM